MADINELVQRITSRHAGELSMARNDTSRTDEWRRQQLARIYLRMKAEFDAELDRVREVQDRERRSLEARVFGLAGLTGDYASLSISRRDAGDRVKTLNTADDALTLLTRADRSGDEPLARAIAELAHDRGWDVVANAFLDTRPQLRSAFDQLWNERPDSVVNKFHQSMVAAGLRPVELSGLDDFKLRVLADEPAA